MGLFNRLIGRQEKAPKEAIAVLSSSEAVSRTMRMMAKGTPAKVAQAGAELATALNTLETAILAIDTVSDLLLEAETLATTARETSSQGRRALAAKRYAALIDLIDTTVHNSAHNGMNLLNGNRPNYQIQLGAEGRTTVALDVTDLTTDRSGLSLIRPREDFASQIEIERTLAEIDAARRTTSRTADLFVDSAAVMAERLSRLDEQFGPDVTIATQASGAIAEQ